MRRRAVRSGVACAVMIATASFGLAGEADLERRVEALEKRLEAVEEALESKDAEIARLERRLRERLPGEGEPLAPEDPAAELDEVLPPPFGDALDRMMEEFRRRGFDWDSDWGLPGRRLDPPRQPRSIPLPGWPRADSGAFLGVELEDLEEGGVGISKIVLDTPADDAGLAEGDVIAEMEGEAVSTSREVVDLVRSKQPGEEVTISVLREGERIEMTVTLGRRPAPEWRLLPRGPSVPGRPGALPRGGAEITPGGSMIGTIGATSTVEVEVEVPGGTAKVSVSAPGLFLTEELARDLDLDLDLDAAARRDVEQAFAKARNDFGSGVSKLVREGGGSVDAGAVAGKRLEAERGVREALEGVLTGEQLERLERAQAELASRSQVSISVTTSSAERRTFRNRNEKPRRPWRRGLRTLPRHDAPDDARAGEDF